ncbi:hypothetical protein RUM43_011866 [Polyplax serrata]|uniref:C2H2-type domain-containing protein n=1 Tax=Polyplax serrata TaxID=468196 RepID=A0AAN8Q3F6_POLSC
MTDIMSCIAAANCSLCQNVCTKCRNICITCKYPCKKCMNVHTPCKSSSTDTDDFDKYLESQCKKMKIQPKVKTIGVDTCDLDGHFDYYNQEKKIIRIQKSVATDCADLNIRQLVHKKLLKTTVATDTNDLLATKFNKEIEHDSDFEIFMVKDQENKTYSNKNNTKSVLRNSNNDIKNNSRESLVKLEDDGSQNSFISEKANDKENYFGENSTRDVTFDSTSTSDESDVDLITSCNVSKMRDLAKKHKISLKQIKKENELLFQCSICGETFHKKYLGTLHLGTHIENDKLKCLRCNEQFKSLDLIFSHVQTHHLNSEEKGEGKVSEKKFGSHNQKPKITKIYHCLLCPNESTTTQFDSYKALYLHKKMKHGVGKTNDGQVKGERKLRIKQEFICLICGKQFKSSKALKDHSPVHTGEKNYHCDICNKSYTTSANLKIHKRTHTGARNFICSVCNKAFHKKDSLKVHFRKHSGERPFQCDLCPMRFDRNYILKNHRYTHFSEKTFICPFCGKTFTTHGGLNNHEKSHKKDPFAKKPRKPAVKPTLETENAVICDVCGKIYSTKSNLRIHKFVHLGIKPFECSVCHQSYAKKDSMLTHMRKHYDDRPFTCETCGMKFYRNHTLKTHLLRHTGERPHKCKICGKSFTQSSSLAYHVKNHDRKMERKQVATTGDTVKAKKKRGCPDNGKPGGSGPPKKELKALELEKPAAEFVYEQGKLYEDKKHNQYEGVDPLENPMTINLAEKEVVKSDHFLLPVPDKEIFILDKNLTVEFTRNVTPSKEIDFTAVEKDGSYSGQNNGGKFNYYIAKSHVFLPKEAVKSKSVKIHESQMLPKSCDEGKEDAMVTLVQDTCPKSVKAEFVDLGDGRLDLKPQTTIPISGEILSAAFISDENGDVIPFSSMTLHGLSADNVMISPVITLEGDEKKGILKSPKLAVVDSKIVYNLPDNRVPHEKVPAKGGCHVISLKESRMPQLKIELESTPVQFQAPMEEGTLQGIPSFYNSVQQNEL